MFRRLIIWAALSLLVGALGLGPAEAGEAMPTDVPVGCERIEFQFNPGQEFGYYADITQPDIICQVDIFDGKTHRFMTYEPGDASYSLAWIGPKIVWITTEMEPDYALYYIGRPERARIYLPLIYSR